MEIPCGYCRTPAPRLRLHRVGNRLLCPSCLSALSRDSANRGVGGDEGVALGLRDGLRRALFATGAGVFLRALLFLPLVLWARGSATGAAALQGAIGGDLFGWAVLSFLLWPLRRAQVGIGAFVELLLVGLYLQRETLFEISADTETTAISVLFFFAVLCGKTGAWAVDHILEITGVKESA